MEFTSCRSGTCIRMEWENVTANAMANLSWALRLRFRRRRWNNGIHTLTIFHGRRYGSLILLVLRQTDRQGERHSFHNFKLNFNFIMGTKAAAGWRIHTIGYLRYPAYKGVLIVRHKFAFPFTFHLHSPCTRVSVVITVIATVSNSDPAKALSFFSSIYFPFFLCIAGRGEGDKLISSHNYIYLRLKGILTGRRIFFFLRSIC